MDNNLSGFVPVTKDRFLQRRQEIFDCFKHAFESDCVTITLGLIECWKDTQRGIYLQQSPAANKTLRRNHRDDVEFEVLDYDQSLGFIKDAIALITTRNPAMKILTTVSPVPLEATFTEKDVISANLYSKSVLVAVANKIEETHDCVGYFPSFERVMLTRNWSVFESDLRHVSDKAVSEIAISLRKFYLDIDADKITQVIDEKTETWERSEKINKIQVAGELAKAEGNHIEAARHFEDASAFAPTPNQAVYLRARSVNMLILAGDLSKAEEKARALVKDAPQDPSALFSLARICATNGNKGEASKLAREALDVQPARDDIRAFLERQSHIAIKSQ